MLPLAALFAIFGMTAFVGGDESDDQSDDDQPNGNDGIEPDFTNGDMLQDLEGEAPFIDLGLNLPAESGAQEPTLADFITDDHNAVHVTQEAYGTVTPGHGDDPTVETELNDQNVITVSDEITFFNVYGGDNVIIDSDNGTTLSSNSHHGAAIFGAGGDDTIFGGFDAPSLLSGGDGDDYIRSAYTAADETPLDQNGEVIPDFEPDDGLVSDTIYGGAGDDVIVRSGSSGHWDAEGAEVAQIDAGAGDDVIHIDDIGALVTLGEGEDVATLTGTYSGDDNITVFTDFNPAEDRVVLSVIDDNGREGASADSLGDTPATIEISYILTEIQTDLGPATLVSPDVTSDSRVADLADTTSSYAVLLGVTPDQLSDDNIDVHAIMGGDANWHFLEQGENIAGV